jgi:hypothetical protein
MIGRRTGLISVELEIRLVDSEGIIQPSKVLQHLERDKGIALAVPNSEGQIAFVTEGGTKRRIAC